MALKRTKISEDEIKQRFNLKKLLGYSPNERQKELFYQLAVDKMVQRTASGKDVNNDNFKPYTKKYADKKGVSKNSVDLILTGDMLKSFDGSTPGDYVEISIDDDQTGKAHGNITGSYGKPTGKKSKARDFFGFKNESDLEDVISQVDNARERQQPTADLTPTALDLVQLRQAMREIEIQFTDFDNAQRDILDGED